jgi:hypothetical protein
MPKVRLLLCCILAIATSGQACECSKQLKAKDAAIAFVGTPTKRIVLTDRGSSTALEWPQYTFTVERTITGPNLRKVVVGTSFSDCGIPFEIGRRYTVVAYSDPERGVQWATDQCTETRPVSSK